MFVHFIAEESLCINVTKHTSFVWIEVFEKCPLVLITITIHYLIGPIAVFHEIRTRMALSHPEITVLRYHGKLEQWNSKNHTKKWRMLKMWHYCYISKNISQGDQLRSSFRYFFSHFICILIIFAFFVVVHFVGSFITIRLF